MAESKRIEEAFQRLDAALDAFESSVAREQSAGEERRRLEAELETLRQDRARLSTELDEARAEANGLKSANRDASVRIDAVMNNIRTLLGGP